MDQAETINVPVRHWTDILTGRHVHRQAFHVIMYVVLTVVGAFLLVPFAWMVSTSLKEFGRELIFPPQWIPNPAVPYNYVEALTTLPFHLYLRNTLIIAIAATFGELITSSMAGYAFARLRFRARNVLFMLALSTMMLPSMVTLIPQFILFKMLGWNDTFLPLIIPSYFGGGAFAIFLFRQFFLTIPYELDEAARVDGADSFYIWFRIMLPLSGPVIATIGILSFIFHWNDFLGPLIYLTNPNNRTVALGLSTLRASGIYETHWNLLMAASAAMLLPVLILFFSAQRYFVKGIVMSGITGR